MLRSSSLKSLARRRHGGLAVHYRSFFVDATLDKCRLNHISKPRAAKDYHLRVAKRYFSDRLLGSSPMAPSAPNPVAPKVNPDGTPAPRIPTAQDVTTSGGVWAPTSAKRDKIAELRVALQDGQQSLDDAATPEQRLDLYLADGMKLIAQTTDSTSVENIEAVPELQGLSEWLVREQGRQPEFFYDEAQFTSHMDVISEKIATIISALPKESLQDVRDFFDPEEAIAEELANLKESEMALVDKPFETATLRLRLMLAKAAVEHAKASWKTLTSVSDGDVDRAAVKGEVVPTQAVSLTKLYKYIFAHASGSCSERVDAAWTLVDRDGDGLLDESEMNEVAFLCIAPVQAALKSVFAETLEASPVRGPLPDNGSAVTPEAPEGWLERRKDKKVKKQLSKLFENATKNHFIVQVEVNHRLRCIYAWAEKQHQGNKLDSVLVDEGWTGRKRYVELSPKISLEEFREVQKEHFTHLDRIGKEILKSFREDLWVQQGKGRERAELIRDSLLFLTVVSLADYLILMS